MQEQRSLTILTAGELELVLQQTPGGIRLQSLFDITAECELLSTCTLPLFTLKLRHSETKEEIQLHADSGWGKTTIKSTTYGAELNWQQSNINGLGGHCSRYYG